MCYKVSQSWEKEKKRPKLHNSLKEFITGKKKKKLSTLTLSRTINYNIQKFLTSIWNMQLLPKKKNKLNINLRRPYQFTDNYFSTIRLLERIVKDEGSYSSTNESLSEVKKCKITNLDNIFLIGFHLSNIVLYDF